MTPANYSDTGEFEAVVEAANMPKDTRYYADKGYTSTKNTIVLQAESWKTALWAKPLELEN